MLIAQLTDLHLRPPGRACYRVVETNMMFERACRTVAAIRPAPDAVILTGDLADRGGAAEYRLLGEILSRTLSMPVFAIPGNHDRRATLLATLSPNLSRSRRDEKFVQYAVEDFPVRIVMLDTLVEGAPQGALDGGRLEWLERTLAARPDMPTLIGMHHPPFICGIGHMDAINLRDSDRFAAVIARHPQVRRIVCGHHHRPVTAQIAQAVVSIAPSVAHQVELDLAEDAPSAFMLEPPAFQLHHWSEAHGFVSHIAFVERFPGPFPFVPEADYWQE